MFGFFKKKVIPEEYGAAIMSLAFESIANDASRSLGTCYPDFNASNGWASSLQSVGIDKSVQRDFICLYAHCFIQSYAKILRLPHPQALTFGATQCLKDQTNRYEFNTAFSDLNSIEMQTYHFKEPVKYLTAPNRSGSKLEASGILNSKYLVSSFVLDNIPNPRPIIENFDTFCSPGVATYGTLQRATAFLSRKVKVVYSG
jgi:hypothetical protein